MKIWQLVFAFHSFYIHCSRVWNLSVRRHKQSSRGSCLLPGFLKYSSCRWLLIAVGTFTADLIFALRACCYAGMHHCSSTLSSVPQMSPQKRCVLFELYSFCVGRLLRDEMGVHLPRQSLSQWFTRVCVFCSLNEGTDGMWMVPVFFTFKAFDQMQDLNLS